MIMNIRKNDPCPCGSGKKFKNCCFNKKPRIWSVTMDMGKPTVVNGVIKLPDGTFELLSAGIPVIPERVNYEVGYAREKKRKLLNNISMDQNRLSANPNLALKKFKFVFALDTNSNCVNDQVISVTGVVLCKLKFGRRAMKIQYAPTQCLEFRNIKDFHNNAEKIGWIKCIQLMLQNPTYNPKWKIGIVVDSDLGNLAGYNNRSTPIYSDFYLPPNFELIYASAEVGKREYLVNRLIATSEKMAKFLLTNILLNKTPEVGLEDVSNAPYTHLRFWDVSGDETESKTKSVILTPVVSKAQNISSNKTKA